MAINSESRAELNYEWVAKYSDGSELRQFDDKNDIENTFGDVDQDKLVEFSVVKKDNNHSLSVNLKTGLFSVNGQVTKSIERDGLVTNLGKELPEGVSIRPIYFRRVLRHINVFEQGSQLASMIHFIGWQGTVDGKYEKHEVGISNKSDELIMPPRESFRML